MKIIPRFILLLAFTAGVLRGQPSNFLPKTNPVFNGTIKGGIYAGTNGQTITSNAAGAWVIAANGTNQSITLTPSGTGDVQTVRLTSPSSNLILTSTTNNVYVRSEVSSMVIINDLTAAHISMGSGGGNILIGSGANGTGRVQIPAATSTAGAIAFGSSAFLYTQVSNGRGINVSGTATNDSAPAGYYGEYVESLVAIGAPQSLSNNTAANVTSISLTAGDWDVVFLASVTETTSTVTARVAGISSTSATLPTDGSEGYNGVQSVVTSETNSIPLAKKRLSLSGTTTIYAVEKVTFSAGTAGGFGALNARRVR